jgi:hypothetical protein
MLDSYLTPGAVARHVVVPMIPLVHRSLVERRLAEVSDRLRALREELHIIDEQLSHLGDDADAAHLRALVSETPLADREHRDARRHADAMSRRRAEVVETIAALEARSDELLDRLIAG